MRLNAGVWNQAMPKAAGLPEDWPIAPRASGSWVSLTLPVFSARGRTIFSM